MKPQTKRDRIIQHLTETMGLHEVPIPNAKYRRFEPRKGKIAYFVGKRGCVRRGTSPERSVSITKAILNSISNWERWKKIDKKILQEACEKLGQNKIV